MERFEYFKYSYKTKETDNILMGISNCGYQRCEKGYTMGPVSRNNYLIHHVVSGKGYYEVNETVYEVKEGDTFIIYPNVAVRYYADQENPWEYYWVGFVGADAKALLARTDFTPKHMVITTHRSQELRELLLSIYHASGDHFHEHVKMVGYLYLFFSVLIESSRNKDYNPDISLTYVQKAVDYISQNYEKRITVTDVAAQLGVSRSHLYRVFMKHLSRSPKAYLESYRVKQGQMMLKNTTLSINEVANSVGYEDPLHFSKVFKKWSGVSPKEYRKRVLHSHLEKEQGTKNSFSPE
jgi:AraC-like DNA-binding protein